MYLSNKLLTLLFFLLRNDSHGEGGRVNTVRGQAIELHRAETHLERVLDVLVLLAVRLAIAAGSSTNRLAAAHCRLQQLLLRCHHPVIELQVHQVGTDACHWRRCDRTNPVT